MIDTTGFNVGEPQDLFVMLRQDETYFFTPDDIISMASGGLAQEPGKLEMQSTLWLALRVVDGVEVLGIWTSAEEAMAECVKPDYIIPVAINRLLNVKLLPVAHYPLPGAEDREGA